MLKKIKKVVSIALSVALLAAATVALTSCGSDKQASGSKTINIRLMNEPKNIDRILNAYYEKVKDDPVLKNIKVNISYVSGTDYKDKLSMAITAQEDYDLMFVGAWQGLNNYASEGSFKDVSSYFNNDDYPGLKAAFSEDFINASKMGDALYSIPLSEGYEDLRGLTYREDLRVKYNVPEITNDETMIQYLQAIKDNETDIYPWIMGNEGFMFIDSPDFKAPHDNIFPIALSGATTTTGAVFYVALDPTATKVIDAVTMGDSVEEHFSKLPEGYNTDFITESYIKKLRWVPYLNDDRISSGVDGRKSAVGYSPISGWAGSENTTKRDEGGELGFYVTEEAQRNMEEGAIVSEMKCNNFLCVPSWSKKTDEVMAFLNWMFSSQENHDLFAYGIEGEDWEAIGDDGFRLIERSETDTYSMPTYSFTLNPTYIRYNETILNNPKIKAYFEYKDSDKPYVKSPLAGFVFDTSNLKTEVASVQVLAESIKPNMGIYGDDTANVIAQYNSDAKKVGLDTLRAELIKQVQEFLDNKNAQ